jgi:hypothetical protein
MRAPPWREAAAGDEGGVGMGVLLALTSCLPHAGHAMFSAIVRGVVSVVSVVVFYDVVMRKRERGSPEPSSVFGARFKFVQKSWGRKTRRRKKLLQAISPPPFLHTTPHGEHTMAPPVTRAQANWAVELATGLPEFWANVAKYRGIVGTCQLIRVCKASHAGGMEHLRTLPGLVVCGGETSSGEEDKSVSDALRLDLATMRWEPVPALVTTRALHACCAVRGAPVVLGGETEDGVVSLRVRKCFLLQRTEGLVHLPPLSCGEIYAAAAIAVEESDSAAGQVLLIGGFDDDDDEVSMSTVQLVDLARAQQPDLLHPRAYPAAGRLADGRVVCAGDSSDPSAEVWGPPAQGAADAAWSWTELPAMSAERYACRECVMSDGHFAVLGGQSNWAPTSSCEALVIDGDAHWVPLPPMHDARVFFACGAIAECIFVAGGRGLKSAELYDAELNRWLRLPCDLPCEAGLNFMGSAVL